MTDEESSGDCGRFDRDPHDAEIGGQDREQHASDEHLHQDRVVSRASNVRDAGFDLLAHGPRGEECREE